MSWPEELGRESLLALDFLDRREDLVLMGDVGTDKTHMPSALRAPTCERRLGACLFLASPPLVMRLRRARDRGKLDREESLIEGVRLLVIDELGVLPLDANGVRLLFQVFGDDQMAAAMIDRIVHHGRLVQFRGEPHRTQHIIMQEG